MTKEELEIELEELAVRFSEGWHEGIKIDASDIMLLNKAAQALAQEQEPIGFVVMENPITPQKLKPLTKEERYNILRQWNQRYCIDPKGPEYLIDMVEQAHGIKEKNT